MTPVTLPPPVARRLAGVRDALTDGSAAAARVLAKLRHDPASIVITLAAPIVMVLVFGFVLGSAVTVPGAGDYREFLLPGLFVTVAFNLVPAMIAMARDAGRGVVDRFRSLPISRVAVPFGQAAATALYGAGCLLLMAGCGLVVGWRIRNGLWPAVGAFALLCAFQYAATWVGMYLGLLIGREDTAAQLSVLVLPVGMLSNVFVPTTGMPAWLRLTADWNPLSAVTTAIRRLFGNPAAATNGAWPLEHSVAASLGWVAILLIVFVPLCAAKYARPGS